MSTRNAGKLALLVGGGPAPGINGVISSATIEAINQGMTVIGFTDGFKWLARGDSTHFRELSIREVSAAHLRGGSILGTARENPTQSEEMMQNVVAVLSQHGITDLVTIGGDDTAYSASQVHARVAGRIRVAHVPKTIDNDLPLPGSTPTFGFETARQIGTQLVRNLAEDARTTGRWYVIVSMGRAAGHLALGIGKAAAATLIVIPEQFEPKQLTLAVLCDIIHGAIIKRKAQERPHGVVVIAEGIIEAIQVDELKAAINRGAQGRYGQVVRDPHGHLRLGEVEISRMIKDLLTERVAAMGPKTTFIDKEMGYELRCADPIPFDSEYTRDLGYGAVKFLRSPSAAKFGAIISLVQGTMNPLPFEEMLDPITHRMRVRRVNVDGEAYECARRYMIRLEREDFEDTEQLAKLAAVVQMTPDQFRDRFGYLVTVEKQR